MLPASYTPGFVTRLQRERYLRGWTQQQTVDRLKRLAWEQGYGQRFDGLDVNTWSRYEHGHIRRPRAPLPELFAALYEVPATALFPAPARPTRWRGRAPANGTAAYEEAARLPAEALWRVLEALAHPSVRAQVLALLDASPPALAVEAGER